MKKEFPVLYKRTKTGAIQSYQIWVEHSGVAPVIIKSTGQVTGKKTLHKEPISAGKNLGKINETSPSEQANANAQSDWTRKYDEGYKSMEDLGITSTIGSWYASPKGTKEHLFEILDITLPKFNTDALGNVKPMLAKAVDWNRVVYPCIVQPKLDGVRCLMLVEIIDKEVSVKFISRNGKEYTTLGHIETDVLKYFTEHREELPIILDGEIYA